MIISRTPFRISFFGGGTDYPVWFREHGGAVLATTIVKYCYISCRQLPPFFEHRTRTAYSGIELVNNNQDIEHQWNNDHANQKIQKRAMTLAVIHGYDSKSIIS